MENVSVPSTFGEGMSAITAISLETFLPLALFAALFAYGLHFGKHRLISLIISFFVAWPLYEIVLNREALLLFTETPLQVAISHGLLFLALLVLIHILFSRIVQAQFPYARISRFFEAGLLALSVLSLLVLSIYHVIQSSAPLVAFIHPSIASVFTTSGAFLLGIAGALVVLAITSRSNPAI